VAILVVGFAKTRQPAGRQRLSGAAQNHDEKKQQRSNGVNRRVSAAGLSQPAK